VKPDGVNFSVFSRHAKFLTLVLFEKENIESVAEIPLDPEINRTGDIWHILVQGMDPSVRYGYRADGPFDPQGEGHWFNKESILLDPYARALEGGETWGDSPSVGTQAGKNVSFQRRCCILVDDFDWEGDSPPNLPLKDSVIYELHVRGYTVHGSSGVTSRGTYKGLIEKIPYIKSLGVTAVELMPVFEFNELENKKLNPKTGERLKNFWGYSTLGFFAPKASYASKGWDGNQVKEFKEMVKAFHCAGLEVIIDVVFNHTAESNSDGPVISFRGLDNTVYYALDPESKEYLNGLWRCTWMGFVLIWHPSCAGIIRVNSSQVLHSLTPLNRPQSLPTPRSLPRRGMHRPIKWGRFPGVGLSGIRTIGTM
jgi:glycogen operon protein